MRHHLQLEKKVKEQPSSMFLITLFGTVGSNSMKTLVSPSVTWNRLSVTLLYTVAWNLAFAASVSVPVIMSLIGFSVQPAIFLQYLERAKQSSI